MAKTLGINLLPKEERAFEKKRIFKRIRNWGVGIIVGYILVTAIILIFGTTLSLQRNEIKRKIGMLEQQIRAQQKKEGLELALKERMGEAGRILKERVSYSNLVLGIADFAPPELSFREFDFSQKGSVSLSGEAANFLALENFLEKLKKRDDFSSVYLNTLSRTKTGGYFFILEIGFKNK